MASLMRNLLRSSSSMRDEGPGQPQLQRSESNMQRSSTSFNDLSLGTSRDAEQEYQSSTESDLTRRSSDLDQSVRSGSSLSTRSSMDMIDLRSHLKRISGAMSGSPAYAGQPAQPQTSAVAIPAAAQTTGQLPSQASCPSGNTGFKNRRRREGKIDGLDYYDWNDMLRTSSL